MHEASLERPEIAGGGLFIRPHALREAMAFIPDEFHPPGGKTSERFVSAVIANARATDRSPYTVALFTLDV